MHNGPVEYVRMKFYSTIRNHSFLFAFIVTGIALLIILLTTPVAYETNDDLAMIAVLSGNAGFPPHHDAVCIHPLLGYLLYLLYTFSPSVPWYGAYLYAAYCLGWSLFGSVMIRVNRGLSLLLALPLFIHYFFYHSSFVNFTSATLFLSFGVYLCLAEYFMKNAAPAKNTVAYLVFLAACLCLSLLLRWKLVLYTLLLCVPLLIFMRREQVKKILPGCVVLAVMIILTLGIDHHMTTSHAAYYDYVKLETVFHGYGPGSFHGEKTLDAARAAGWSMDDYTAFRQLWLIYDNHMFNKDTLKTFITLNDPHQDLMYVLKFNIQNIVSNFKAFQSDFLLLFVSVLSMLLYRSRDVLRLRHIDVLKIVLTLGILASSILFFMFYRFQARVYGPLFVYLLGMVVLLTHALSPSEGRTVFNKTWQYVTAGAAGVLCVVSAVVACQELGIQREILMEQESRKLIMRQSLERIVTDYHSSSTPGADPILIQMDPGIGIGMESCHPLREFNDLPDIRIFPCGWLINSPYYDSALKDLGFRDGHDFLRRIVNRMEMLLVMDATDPGRLNAVVSVWKSYYFHHVYPGVELDFKPVHAEGNLIFFQIRSYNLY